MSPALFLSAHAARPAGRACPACSVCRVLVLFLFPAVLGACSLAPVPESRPGCGVLTWNLQNLFDAVDDGSEYSEFSAASWTWEAYRDRLATFAGLLAALPAAAVPGGAWPDVMVFQEVEHGRVLDALVAALQEKIPGSFPYVWHGVCPKTPDSPVTLGVLARQPPVLQRAHRLWVDGATSRMVWELQFELPGLGETGAGGRLVVFANHWKSKSGGEAESEALRRAAAELVRQRSLRLQTEGRPTLLVCAGDLNTQGLPGEAGGEAQALVLLDRRLAAGAAGTSVDPASGSSLADEAPAGVLYLVPPGTWAAHAACPQDWLAREPGPVGNGAGLSGGATAGPEPGAAATEAGRLWEEPWLALPPTSGGSYYYDSAWERIDHILYRPAGGWTLDSFGVPDLPGLRSGEGLPQRYQTGTRRGVSDHLPLLAWFGPAE